MVTIQEGRQIQNLIPEQVVVYSCRQGVPFINPLAGFMLRNSFPDVIVKGLTLLLFALQAIARTSVCTKTLSDHLLENPEFSSRSAEIVYLAVELIAHNLKTGILRALNREYVIHDEQSDNRVLNPKLLAKFDTQFLPRAFRVLK
jgi:hypothetical protein